MNSNPVLFACGVPRSGTTLLQRMLDHHPDMTVANDTHFIPRALERTDPTLVTRAEAGEAIELTDRLAEELLNYHRFSRMKIDNACFSRIRNGCQTYQELVGSLYDEIADRAGKPLAGEKTPDYLRRISLLHGLFPGARFIHMIRDGRDTALSLLQWSTPTKGPGRLELWASEPLAVCAMWWAWMIRVGQQQALADPSILCLPIHYEQLCREPAESAARISEFLGLDFHSDMLNYHRGRIKKQARGLSAKSAWLTPQIGLRDWRQDMQPAQVQLFEALAGDLLEQLGYQRSCDQISPAVLEVAQSCQQWWDQNFRPARIVQASVRADEPLSNTVTDHQRIAR